VFASEGRIGKFCAGKQLLFIVRVAVSEIPLIYIYTYIYIHFFFCGAASQRGPWHSHSWGF